MWRFEQLKSEMEANVGRAITYAEFEAQMNEGAKQRKAPFGYAMRQYGISSCGLPYRQELETVYPEARQVLEKLHAAGYRIGIIANQRPELPERLTRYGFGDYLDAVFGSEDVQLSKPDVAFYQYALEQTHCAPQEAVMIGDRVDNDIAPAHKVGMKGVRLLSSYFAHQLIEFPEEEPDATIHSLDELPAVLAALS